MIAEVCTFLVTFFLRGRFLAVLGIGDAIFDTHLADMDFGITFFTNVQTPKRKRQFGQGVTAMPTNKKRTHFCGFYFYACRINMDVIALSDSHYPRKQPLTRASRMTTVDRIVY